MKKVYQVNEKHFYQSLGIDYLSALSPFTKRVAYKNKKTALMVAKSILNDHRDLEDTLKIDELKELFDEYDDMMKKAIVSKNYVGVVHKKYGNVKRIVVVVEEIEIQ